LKTVGIIGCGAIGSLIAKAIDRKLVICDLLVVYDQQRNRALLLKKQLQVPVEVANSVDELLERRPTVVVEAASQQAVKEYLNHLLSKGVDVIVMSTGALIDMGVSNPRVHVPSGAVGGLDAIRSAALAGIRSVTLQSKKNPRALDMSNTAPQVVYEGVAEEAVKLYPREMNVAATLALTVKPTPVKVQIISDPNVFRNTHEIYVEWTGGTMKLEFANDPHPENPRTSALAAWSAISLLKTLLDAKQEPR
jgi:aspartate dehydrogenase